MNKEKLQGYFEQVKMALGKISKKIWIIIGVTVAALAIGIVIFLNTRPYATLIAGATNEEAGAVLSWLQEQGITNYRMEGTGTILVPEGQAASLKARLLVHFSFFTFFSDFVIFQVLKWMFLIFHDFQ